MFRSCSFEKEVAQTLNDGHWPDGCAEELRAHVKDCASCADFVLVTQTFRRAKSESIDEVSAGSPGLVWWRAQLQRRNAMAARVNRPTTIAQAFAWIVAALVGVIFVAAQYSRGIRWPEWLSNRVFWRASSPFSGVLAGSGWNSLLLICGIGALACLSGLVVYLASERS